MRVAQIIDSLAWGGAQKMQVFLAHVMSDRPVEMIVISLRSSGNAPFCDQIEALGTKVYILKAPHLFDLHRLRQIKQILIDEKIDLVHAHLSYANILGTLVARWARIPVIATLRTAGLDKDFYNPLRFWIETWALRHLATKIMANGYAVADAHSRRLRGRTIEVIPNAIELPEQISEAERKQIRQEMVGNLPRPWVIAVGRLAQPKGFHDLVEAFAIIRSQYPNAYLTIVGSGRYKALALQSQIDRLNLSEHVILTGERSDVPRLLMASDIFVSSSHWEGMSVAILEAMAAGKPIIATAVGDSPKVVVAGTGLIVPPRQPQKLAQAIITLLANPAQIVQFGHQARCHIAENYTPEVWGDQIMDLYIQTLGDKFDPVAIRATPPASASVSPAAIKVAMLIQDYLPVGGGAERQIASLAPLLHAKNVEISIITRRYSGLSEYENMAGVRVYRLPIPGPKPVASVVFTLSALPLLRRLQPDILHAHGLLSPTTIAILAKKMLGIPIIAKVLRGGRLGDIDRILSKSLSAFRRKSIGNNVDRVLVISAEISAELTQFGIPENRQIRLPNGVDTEKFSPVSAVEKASLRQRLNLPTAGPIAIFTGRLAREKQVDQLVMTWNAIQAENPQAILLLVGSGELKNYLVEIAGPGVRLLGYSDQVADYLKAADIFVLPSLTEGLSNALLEAMSTGLCVVATNVGGAPDLIDHGQNGWLIDPGDPAQLKTALKTVLKDTILRKDLGFQARQIILAKFTLPVIADRLYMVYAQMLAADSDEAHSRLVLDE